MASKFGYMGQWHESRSSLHACNDRISISHTYLIRLCVLVLAPPVMRRKMRLDVHRHSSITCCMRIKDGKKRKAQIQRGRCKNRYHIYRLRIRFRLSLWTCMYVLLQLSISSTYSEYPEPLHSAIRNDRHLHMRVCLPLHTLQ